VRIVVSRVSAAGFISRGEVVTDLHPDGASWEDLVQRAALDFPPPYQPEPGRSIYLICIGGPTVVVGDANLLGPLRDLVEAVLASASGMHGRHEAQAQPNLSVGLTTLAA
jgi:hypothetical protein